MLCVFWFHVSDTMATGDPQVPTCTVFIVTAITLTVGSEDLKSIFTLCVFWFHVTDNQIQYQLVILKSPFATCLHYFHVSPTTGTDPSTYLWHTSCRQTNKF